MRNVLLIGAMVFSSWSALAQVSTPDQVYGELFRDVQEARIFPDGKTFVDCVPKRDPSEIVKDYLAAKKNPALRFSLELFVKENFDLPVNPAEQYKTDEAEDITTHINKLWKVLRREADLPVKGSSLLPLPNAYIVPGGRFREIYYWDSYFTMLGLKESGEHEILESMVRNFAYLIDTYGHIPNGNRSYYISRSQPPFFAMMVELLASIKGEGTYKEFLPALEKEYAYWMDGETVVKPGAAIKSVVKMKDGTILNRYWDESREPRQESYREDVETARLSKRNKVEMYQHLRAGAASGWDFSSRWFADRKNITSIQTTYYIPVDLNSLLYKLELVLSTAYLVGGNALKAQQMDARAEKRRVAVDKYCWNKSLKFYTDVDYRTGKSTGMVTPAGLFPYCFFPQRQGFLSMLANQSVVVVKEKLLKPGGIVTSEQQSGQQWDAPNGWAPLQWMAVVALDRCGQRGMARDICTRWMKLNEKVYKETGKLMEKYNVMNIDLPAGGGEYAAQDGFGWTNGVYLAMQAWMKKTAN